MSIETTVANAFVDSSSMGERKLPAAPVEVKARGSGQPERSEEGIIGDTSSHVTHRR